jgi:hypothetical protein
MLSKRLSRRQKRVRLFGGIFFIRQLIDRNRKLDNRY